MKTTEMPTSLKYSKLLGSIAVIAGGVFCLGGITPSGTAPVPPVLAAMKAELDRSITTLGKAEPSNYFLSYTVSDREIVTVSGSNGALLTSDDAHGRWLEVQSRVGTYQLDSTHKIGERAPIWTSQQVQVQTDEGNAPDFSHETPHTFIGTRAEIKVDRKPWEEKLRKYTAAFSTSPDVLNSIATFTAQAANQYQLNSEGTELAFGQLHYRLELFVQSKAPDGMDINRFANFDWIDPKEAPDDKAVFEKIRVLINELEALDRAPLVDPYAGPALLTGRATAVFFHEVLGHRLEGFRQKDISEGQTFTKKIGEQILPSFISVKDDPTEQRLNGQMLLGYYPYDDEGVPAQNVHLVDNGVLKTFMMGRSPLVDVPHSNGHGRRQLGFQPIARMGNTIVTSTKTVTNAELRKKLIELIKSQ